MSEASDADELEELDVEAFKSLSSSSASRSEV